MSSLNHNIEYQRYAHNFWVRFRRNKTAGATDIFLRHKIGRRRNKPKNVKISR